MTALITAIVAVYFLWPAYVFCMAMVRAYDEGKVSIVAWVLAAPLVLAAIALDVFLNFTVFALMTWDFPRRGEWTFSQRLSRLVRQGGARGKVAEWLAYHLLDPFDPSGKHIK